MIVLSVVIVVGRFQPENRGLRKLQVGLSALLGTFGVIAALVCLYVMWLGGTYRGTSDGGAMAAMSGYYVFYPSAALLVLPFALNLSRLQPRLRLGLWVLSFLLVVLP